MADSSKNKWVISVAVSAGAIMATIDTFVLFVATPHLRGVFSATTSEISWLSISYAVASLVMMPVAAWLANNYGVKWVYKLGLAVFVLGSVCCAASQNLEMLIAFRILQGLGSGILIPVEQLILRKTFPPKDHRIAMAIYGMSVMVGPAIGPFLGGYIVENFHWAYIFLINIPIGLVGYIAVNRFVPKSFDLVSSTDKNPDWIGILLLAVGIFSLVWLLERGTENYWFESSLNVFLAYISVSSLVLFLTHERVTVSPLINLRVFKYPGFLVAVTMSFILAFLVSATLFLLPVFMQDVLEFTPTKAGISLMPRALFMMVMFPIVAVMLKRIEPKSLIIFGILCGGVSSLMMSYLTHEAGQGDVVYSTVLNGIAVAFILTPLSAFALNQVPKADFAAAASVDSICRQLGGVIGIAAFISLSTELELEAWGNLRHNVNLAFPFFNQRFGGVVAEFMVLNVVDYTSAVKQAFRATNFRVEQQAKALSHMLVFQWATIFFLGMLALSFFVRVNKNIR